VPRPPVGYAAAYPGGRPARIVGPGARLTCPSTLRNPIIETTRQRAVVAAVQLPSVSDLEFEASLSELRQLAKTLGFDVVGSFTQRRAAFDQEAYFGTGKRAEIRRYFRNEPEPPASGAAARDLADYAAFVEGAAGLPAPGAAPARETGADPVDAGADAAVDADAELDPRDRRADILLVDHEISPSQARNLEKAVGVEVMDRTMVILEIFHRHARSRAAKAQVEIVRLGYMAPRMREAAKIAGPQGRQRSGVGGRGAGESRGELDRRKIRDRIAELQEELDALDVERMTQRARRQERMGLARVAFVGYTNAGKSTLVRALTGSEVLVADKLFATLDTTVRALQPESVPRILVSDTVGFIKNLPHGLVASFKSTLDEALEASLLAHVVDASDPAYERQLAVTVEVLGEIGAGEVPRLLVFNKIDRAGDEAAQQALEAHLQVQHPGCLVMSARRPGDVARLRQAFVDFFRQRLVEAEVLLPWTEQQLRGEIFAHCEVLAEHADEAGAHLRLRGEPERVRRLLERLDRTRTAAPGGDAP
jgi:GTP-binding protein HflX